MRAQHYTIACFQLKVSIAGMQEIEPADLLYAINIFEKPKNNVGVCDGLWIADSVGEVHCPVGTREVFATYPSGLFSRGRWTDDADGV